MARFKFFLASIFLICLMGGPLWANEAYVTDVFKITLRTGPSTANQIIAMLPSGEAVETFESNGDWTRVRVGNLGENGKEGWVLSRYLMTRQPWEKQAAALKYGHVRIKHKLARIEGELRQKIQDFKVVSTKLRENGEGFRKLREDYESLREGAADYLKLKGTYEKTRSALEATKREVQRLNEETVRLRASQRYEWIGMGALVLLMGLIIGAVIGRKEKKRRSSLYA